MDSIEFWVRKYLDNIEWPKTIIDREKYTKVISKISYNVAKELKTSGTTVSRLHKYLYPDKNGTIKPHNYILKEFNKKVCLFCKKVKDYNDFFDNNVKNNYHESDEYWK